MSVEIRPLRPEDRARWDPLWQGYLAFYGQDLPQAVSEETWRRLLGPDTDMHGLCAVTGGDELVGIVHYQFHPVTWSIAPRCYLEDLFVSQAARGEGAGEKAHRGGVRRRGRAWRRSGLLVDGAG